MPKRSASAPAVEVLTGVLRPVLGYLQVSRDLDGTIGDDDVIILPRKKMKFECPALAFIAQHSEEAEQEKMQYIRSCPWYGKDDSARAKILARYEQSEFDNGCLWLRETWLNGDRYESIGIDGDTSGRLQRWLDGKAIVDEMDPKCHIPEIKELLKYYDEDGPIYLTPEEYKIAMNYDEDTPEELEVKTEFARGLKKLLEAMLEDCPLHLLLTMGPSDLACFTGALSRLPQRPGQQYDDEPPSFVLPIIYA